MRITTNKLNGSNNTERAMFISFLKKGWHSLDCGELHALRSRPINGGIITCHHVLKFSPVIIDLTPLASRCTRVGENKPICRFARHIYIIIQHPLQGFCLLVGLECVTWWVLYLTRKQRERDALYTQQKNVLYPWNQCAIHPQQPV